MKRFIRNIILVLAPFVLAASIEMALPIDTFCFRAIEAIGVCTFTEHFPGPFYPWRVLDREEVGNLAAHTPYAVPRRTHWVTDRYGFRYDEADYAGDQFDVVIVGDSQIQGSGVTQSDMLDVVLAKRTGLHIYPYASYSLNDFLDDPRFKQFPPKLVIFAKTESGLLNIPERHEAPFDRSGVYKNRGVLQLFILGDRLTKMAMLKNVLATGRSWLKKIYFTHIKPRGSANQELSAYARLATTGTMIHLTAEIRQPLISDSDVEQCAKRLDTFRNELAAREIAFLFLPIPNKSSIYYETVPWKNPPDFLPRLYAALERYNITQIDTLSAFIKRRGSPTADTVLYQTDDTHWSREGIRAASEALAPKIKALVK